MAAHRSHGITQNFKENRNSLTTAKTAIVFISFFIRTIVKVYNQFFNHSNNSAFTATATFKEILCVSTPCRSYSLCLRASVVQPPLCSPCSPVVVFVVKPPMPQASSACSAPLCFKPIPKVSAVFSPMPHPAVLFVLPRCVLRG